MGLFTPLYMKSSLSPQQLEKVRAKVMEISDPTRLGEIAREAPLAELRKAAVNKLRDKALLTKIAGGDESPDVREAAIEWLEDDTVLMRIARMDASTRVRQAATRRVKQSQLLAELARDSTDEEVRVIAVSRLSDLPSLYEIALEADNSRVQSQALYEISNRLLHVTDQESILCLITDQRVLERFLEKLPRNGSHTSLSCCTAIIRRLTDQTYLTAIARDAPESVIRMSAVRRLTDPATLASIASNDANRYVREAALTNGNLVSNPEFLGQAVLDPAYGEDVKLVMIQQGITDTRLLSRIARESDSPRVRQAALLNPHFDDPPLLAMLACGDASAAVRRTAVSSIPLQDSALMVRVALEDEDISVRCAAVPRVTDVQALEEIATSRDTIHRAVRFLSALQLSRLDALRAVGPLVELICENHTSLVSSTYYDYKSRLREAMDFLKQTYQKNADSDEGRTIRKMNGHYYGFSGDSGCLHADDQVHFDLFR